MEVTYVGWISMPLGLIIMIFRPEWLYFLMVFFIGFSATSVVNYYTDTSGSGLQISMFFGTLWILSTCYGFLKRKIIRINTVQIIPFSLLSIFLLVCLVSLVMPWIINGRLAVAVPVSERPFDVRMIMEPLYFSVKHIIHLLYLTYGVAISILVAMKNTDPSKLHSSLKVYIFAGLFVSVWGFFQMFSSSYPDYLFNNNINDSTKGYLQELPDSGIKRMSSVSIEPAGLAQFLLSVVPFCLFSYICSRPLISPAADLSISGLILIALVLSTSTTSYFGMIFMFLTMSLVMICINRLYKRFAYVLVLILLFYLAAYLFFPEIGNLIEEQGLNKLSTGSGIERVTSIMTSWEYFYQYPILGIGWGGVSSHDLVVKILASTGILGFATFVIAMMFVISGLIKSHMAVCCNATERYQSWTLGGFCAIATLLAVSSVSEFAYHVGHFWFVLGMAMAIPPAIKNVLVRRCELAKAS